MYGHTPKRKLNPVPKLLKYIPGLKQTLFSRRDEGDIAHFLLVTVWDSMEYVGAFAGADPSKAKYYPEDDKYLLEKEDASLNHTIFFSE